MKKRILLKIFSGIIFTISLIVSCNPIYKTLDTFTYYNKAITNDQLDSIIFKEQIDYLDSVGYITIDNKQVKEYFYIKDSLLIRIIKDRDSLRVTKRINK